MPTLKLTDEQKSALARWEPRLRSAAKTGDYEAAKTALARIQVVLRPTGHETRLQQAKNWLFEAALESGRITSTAIPGFIGVRQRTRPTTRAFLEATALLAICYLRLHDFTSAEPLMAEAIRRDVNISSVQRRAQFRRRMIDRFEAEWVLSTLKKEGLFEALDPAAMEAEAGRILMTQTDDEILERTGRSIPPQIVQAMFKVYDFARTQVPPAEQRYLPSSNERRRQKEVGKTVLHAAKHVLWRSLCDPKNDVYKLWNQAGVQAVIDKKMLGPAIVLALGGVGIAQMALAAALTALLLKMGIGVFCEWSRPESLMIARNE